MIYFVQAGEAVKIGWTKDNATLGRRMASLQCGQPVKLVVLRTIDAPRWAEAWLHGFFAGARLAGEWFRFTENMLPIEIPQDERLIAGPTIADELRAWRTRHGWSQSGAAEVLGIPFRTYQHWEARDGRGLDHPSIVRLAMYAIDSRHRPH